MWRIKKTCTLKGFSSTLHQTLGYKIYIYAFSRRFHPKSLTVHSSYTYCYQYVFPGNRTHDLLHDSHTLTHTHTYTHTHTHTHTHTQNQTSHTLQETVRCLIHSVQGFFSLSAKQQEFFYNACWSCTDASAGLKRGPRGWYEDDEDDEDDEEVGLVQVSSKETQNKHIYKSSAPKPSEQRPNVKKLCEVCSRINWLSSLTLWITYSMKDI